MFCSGNVPAPHATVIGGYPVYSFSGSSKPFGDGAASALGLLVVAPLPRGVSASEKLGASGSGVTVTIQGNVQDATRAVETAYKAAATAFPADEDMEPL